MRHLLRFFAFSIVALGTRPLAAEPTPFRQRVAETSLRVGLGTTKRPLLSRAAGAGRDAVVSRLLDRFADLPAPVTTNGVTNVRSENDHVLVQGRDWLLDVRGTGDWVRFFDTSYVDGPENSPLPTEARPSTYELEATAREFIAAHIPDLVPLGPGEDLLAWQTSYGVSVVEEVGGPRTEEVTACRIVFTRTIGGLPVVGDGSKVVVHVAANGVPYGFSVDWSSFVTTTTQQAPVPLSNLRERGAMLTLAHGKAAVSDRVEDRFECGYYDPGALVTSARVELGCLSSYRSTEAPLAAFVDAIPAATSVVVVKTWPETMVLAAALAATSAETTSETAADAAETVPQATAEF
ncbi:MAG: hypothetical protein JW751_10870 [Polyangiaceae bacterium]|nr:hypothetical protein [Polyangiaceae bacterium]